MKKKNEELKILVITTKNGMKREIRKMIEGRVMRLEFKKVKNIRDIPSKQFLRKRLAMFAWKNRHHTRSHSLQIP